ncbi:MAG: hypothetical protein ABI234_15050 [Ktedonobacteraceae bacterium]
MAKKQLRALALLLAALAFGSIVLISCARPGTGTANTTPSAPAATQAPACPAGDTVKTGASTFEQPCIALSKGGTLKLVPDTGSVIHILDFGQYVNGKAQPATPTGAPALKDVNLTSSAVSVGPFTTAGTYHIYCTIHPNMDMIVMVQ